MTGRQNGGLTKCLPCRLGHSAPGADRCSICEKNEFFHIDVEKETFGCQACAEGSHSQPGSVGKESCIVKRPCDEADIDTAYSQCENGKQIVTYSWASHHDGEDDLDCNPEHKDSKVKFLPKPSEIGCKECTLG